jgi:hypothetical protein
VHTNVLGFSGTQGSFVWMHDNDFYDNAIGISYDSELDHPNFPERFSLIENNLIHDNNLEIYDADTPVPAGGPGYGFFRYPVGTGMWIVGGDDNIVRNNYFYNNKRMGMILARNPLEPDPQNPPPPGVGTSAVNRNQIYGNYIGIDPTGAPAPNLTAFPPGGDYAPGGSDLWWDESGTDNCWGPQDPSSGPIETDPPNGLNPLGLPGPCPGLPNAGAGNALKLEILANCAMDGKVCGGGGNDGASCSDPSECPSGTCAPHTNDVTYPCPWGQTNYAPYQNKDEAECGNYDIDLGEQCDKGYPTYWPPNLNGETCASLGHDGGDLGCKSDCTWDFSACDIGGPSCGVADACGSYIVKSLRLSRMTAPVGDEKLVLKGLGLDGAGRTFDPLTEDVGVIVRDQSGVVHTAVIPAGSPGWHVRPLTGPAEKYSYRDSAGTLGGITKIVLRNATGFGGPFRADVKIKDANLSAASDASAVTVNLRVGNDCWERGAGCKFAKTGKTARCQTPQGICPAP